MDQTAPFKASPQAIHPATPGSTGVRLLSSSPSSDKSAKAISSSSGTASSSRKVRRAIDVDFPPSIDSITPNQPEKKKRSGPESPEKKVFYKKVIYAGGKFEVGDDVYLKRKERSESDREDPDVQECRVCSRCTIMIQCDDCFSGFNLKCVKPTLPSMFPDWFCTYCTDIKKGKEVTSPKPPEEKKIKRTSKEKLLSGDLWAARIESLWREEDGIYWLRCRRYRIPEETTAGRPACDIKRELYLTNDFCDIEMECVLGHCFVLNPEEFRETVDDGDDAFFCEYEYDIHCHNFTRISDLDNDHCNDNDSIPEVNWGETESSCESKGDSGNEKEENVALDSGNEKVEDEEKEESEQKYASLYDRLTEMVRQGRPVRTSNVFSVREFPIGIRPGKKRSHDSIEEKPTTTTKKRKS